MLAFDEILDSFGFWFCLIVGYATIALLMFFSKMQGVVFFTSIWIKLITILLIPVIAWAFAEHAEGD